jgi:hypothetical protein
MGKLGSMIAAAMAAIFLMAQPASAATTIVSINLFSGDSEGNCADTTPLTPCSPLGVTQAGNVSNPFLNDQSTKAIQLGAGSYYLFGNPWAGTSYMTQGSQISMFVRLSTNVLVIMNSIVPDLSIAGTTIFQDNYYKLSIRTTGITDANRMSFGYPPSAFAPDGYDDFVLTLDYDVSPPVAAVPEPATWLMMIGGFALIGFALRGRRAMAIVTA